MKTLKTLTVAIAAAASLAFWTTSARAIPVPPIAAVTNYSTVTFSATIVTNRIVENTTNAFKSAFVSQKLVTKDLLNLLTNADFANKTFPAGSKLVVGWDSVASGGHLLVVDGTNVVYDATVGTGGNNVVINLYNQTGASSVNADLKGTGSGTVTWDNFGSFKLTDRTGALSIGGTGPCTEHYSSKGFQSSTNSPDWTDSQTFNIYGASITNGYPNLGPGTLTGSINVSGHGKGNPTYLQTKTGF